MWKCLCSSLPCVFPSSPFTVLGCQAILVSDRNKSFRRGSVSQPLSPTKSSRIRSRRPLSPQPAGLGEIYCEERKKVVISWHFHDETWPKLCWLGGLEAHKECACVWPSPSQSSHHRLTHEPPSLAHPPPLRFISPFCGPAGLVRVHHLPIDTSEALHLASLNSQHPVTFNRRCRRISSVFMWMLSERGYRPITEVKTAFASRTGVQR